MWKKNTDTGKWIAEIDSLAKENFDFYKQEYKKVKLYSKCLSGSTYMTINDFENLYPQLNATRHGFYLGTNSVSIPVRGSNIKISKSNVAGSSALTYDEFYKKYLKEDAFSVKNLFTPERILQEQGVNFKYVDVSTTESITFEENPNLTIDGIPLRNGLRVLVKDQTTINRIPLSTNLPTYFRNSITVSNAYFLNQDNDAGLIRNNYFFYNEQNGIYKYNGSKLVREDDLSSYDKAFKYSVYVQSGVTNSGKEFHLQRQILGYYPVEGLPMEFKENKNWVLRHRVDYNNIYELNMYDAIYHGTQTIWSERDSRTYSIPQRTLSVGEFGAIINNQDKQTINGTYSYSNILKSKFKVTLNSIVNCTNNYWICGNEGTLLKMDKISFEIEKIELNEELDLMSLSFFGDQYGWVVGKFNTIYYTRDFGKSWKKLVIEVFDKYSYTRVVHLDETRVYVAGEFGSFIEFTWQDGVWVSYDKVISKVVNEFDEYILSEDITDMKKTNWVVFKTFSYQNVGSTNIGQSQLIYNYELIDNFRLLRVSVEADFFQNSRFTSSYLFIGFSMSTSSKQGGNFYRDIGIDTLLDTPSYNTRTNWAIYNKGKDKPSNVSVGNTTPLVPYQKLSFTVSLPVDNEGNLRSDNYSVQTFVRLSHDPSFNTNLFLFGPYRSSHGFSTKKNDLLLMSTNNKGLICYDIDNTFSTLSNKFLYLTFTQTNADIKTLDRNSGSQDVYVGAESIYKFKIMDMFNIPNPTINEALITLSHSESLYVNRINSFRSNGGNSWTFSSPTFSLLYVGNNGLNRYLNTTDGISQPTFSNPLDPTFNSRFKSKFLILDYDVASKLNFFTDDGEYRLPNSISLPRSGFTVSSGNTRVILSSTQSEQSWIDYSKDAEKTFQYLSRFEDQFVVKYSSTFSYFSSTTDFIVPPNAVGITGSDFIGLAPHLSSATGSKMHLSTNFIPATTFTYRTAQANQTRTLYLDRDIGIFIRYSNTVGVADTNPLRIGDVLYLSSNVVDTNFVINRIEYYQASSPASAPIAGINTLIRFPGGKPTAAGTINFYEFCYFYTNFDKTITRELASANSNIRLSNLNNYSNLEDFIAKAQIHPIGKAYGITTSGRDVVVSAKFNEKTSYYNQQLYFSAGTYSDTLTYTKTFLDFGYSPTYNLLGYLNKISPITLTAGKVFNVVGSFSLAGIPQSGNRTKDTVFFDLTGKQDNVLNFGEDCKFDWDSLLKYTFIDLIATDAVTTYRIDRLLILDKYEITATNAYVVGGNAITGTAYCVKFDRPLPFPNPVNSYRFLNRNRLSQISDDLRLLDNIQKATASKSVRSGFVFQDSQTKLVNKFPTESYMKILLSDFDVRTNLSAVLYTDYKFDLALNVVKMDEENNLSMDIIQLETVVTSLLGKMRINKNSGVIPASWTSSVEVGDLIYVDVNEKSNNLFGYSGWSTVLARVSNGLITSVNVSNPSPVLLGIGGATLSYFKRDPFFNYQPIDVFKAGVDLKVARSVEVKPQSLKQIGNTFSLVNLDLNKFKFEFLDGLSLEEVFKNHHWILEAEVSDVKLGKDANTGNLIWYSGIWRCGRWFDATWISGMWISGDWYSGTWNSLPVKNNKVFDNSITNEQDPKFSKWYSGRWFDGTWVGGTWYNGRRYAGDWNSGIWRNGIWNDGNWNGGEFTGGIWILGNWRGGVFNCDTKPSYWLDGTFISGDFENGMWYNGQFGNNLGLPSRFGTRSSNNRTSTWHGGRWINGQFHSSLNVNEDTGLPKVSKIHKYSIWRTGIWSNGNFYGGIAYNIDFKGGIWHGGILDEIQVIGIDRVASARGAETQTSPPTNIIYLNGVFKFNPGDEIWIIDNKRGKTFSVLGSDANPRNYRINQIIEDEQNNITGLYLNYKLESLNVPGEAAYVTYSIKYNNLGDLGVRVVGKFTEAKWKSGQVLNGYFQGGEFLGGIWYNGVFDANWGK